MWVTTTIELSVSLANIPSGQESLSPYYSCCPCPPLRFRDAGVQVQKSYSLWGTHLRLRGQWEAVTDKPVRKADVLARARCEKYFKENLARLGDTHIHTQG